MPKVADTYERAIEARHGAPPPPRGPELQGAQTEIGGARAPAHAITSHASARTARTGAAEPRAARPGAPASARPCRAIRRAPAARGPCQARAPLPTPRRAPAGRPYGSSARRNPPRRGPPRTAEAKSSGARGHPAPLSRPSRSPARRHLEHPEAAAAACLEPERRRILPPRPCHRRRAPPRRAARAARRGRRRAQPRPDQRPEGPRPPRVDACRGTYTPRRGWPRPPLPPWEGRKQSAQAPAAGGRGPLSPPRIRFPSIGEHFGASGPLREDFSG